MNPAQHRPDQIAVFCVLRCGAGFTPRYLRAMKDETIQAKSLRIPSGRLSRSARMGSVSARIAGAVVAGGARELLSGRRPVARDLLLTPANARRLTEELSRMRGAAMKMGQLLSMEAGDFLPPELSDILARLRAEAHVMPPAQLKRVLQDSYGKDALRRFRRFDPRPVAAASIGQVHRAETREGHVIALKIQYPGVRDAIDADVANLGTLLRLSGLLPQGFDLSPFLDEARRQLHDEADYRREAEALLRFGQLVKDQPDVVVPTFFPEVSTDTVLAMSFVDSSPIEALETAPQAARDSAATRLFDIFLREVLEWRVVQTDPNFANFRYQPTSGRLVLLDFGATRPVPEAFVLGCQRLLQAGVAGDLRAVMDGLCALSILPQDLSPGQSEVIAQMAHLILPMLSQDITDFDDPERLAALREAGARLGLDEGFRHIPPWDALYLQRKLGGLVLLATRLRARVPLALLVQEALARIQRVPLKNV